MTHDRHWPEAGEVACSYCNARVGDPCTTRNGRVAEQTHAMRVDLAMVCASTNKTHRFSADYMMGDKRKTT